MAPTSYLLSKTLASEYAQPRQLWDRSGLSTATLLPKLAGRKLSLFLGLRSPGQNDARVRNPRGSFGGESKAIFHKLHRLDYPHCCSFLFCGSLNSSTFAARPNEKMAWFWCRPLIPSCVGHAIFTSIDTATNAPATTVVIGLALILFLLLLDLQCAPVSRNRISSGANTLKRLLGPQLIE